MPSSGGKAPLMVLAWYAKFSFAEADGRTAAIDAINAAAVAAARCVPAIPLAGALSTSPGAQSPECWSHCRIFTQPNLAMTAISTAENDTLQKMPGTTRSVLRACLQATSEIALNSWQP